MFDLPFDVLALLVAIVALVIARKAFNQAAELRERLDAIQALAAAAAHDGRCRRRHPRNSAEPAPAAGRRTRTRRPLRNRPRPAPKRRRLDLDAARPASRRRHDLPPRPPPPAQPGFEERLGTRWVVWIGGLTLALGGFFMVRYSIEAGLLGPGVRTILGGLFALALLAAGEWTRRKESISADRRAADRQHPGHPDRGRHRGRVRHRLCRLRALRLPRTRHRLHPARAGRARHARRRAAARTCAGRPRRRRRLRHADPGLLRQARLLGALYLSRHRHRGFVRPRAHPAVALARGHHHRLRAVLDVALPRCGPSMDRPACVPCHRRLRPRGAARGLRLHVRPGGRRKDEIEPISSGSLAAYLFGATLIVLTGFHADAAMIAFGLLVAGTLVRRLARASGHRRRSAPPPRFVFIVFAEWAVRGNPDMLVIPGGPLPGIGPERHRRFGVAASGHAPRSSPPASALPASWRKAARQAPSSRWSGRRRPCSRRWRCWSRFTPASRISTARSRLRSSPCILAAAFAARDRNPRPREDRPGLPTSIALFATGTLAALALALTFALEKGWLTIALALMSLGTAWISLQRPIPFLRTLAAILAGIVVLRDRLRAAHRGRRRRHHADLQLAAVGLWHSRAVVLGRQLSSCAATATMRRCASWKPPRSCSRCCWRSWKSAMPSTMATSIRQAPA